MIRRRFRLDPSQIPIKQHFAEYAAKLGKQARVRSLATGPWQLLGMLEAFQFDGVEVVSGHNSAMEYERAPNAQPNAQPVIAVSCCFEGQLAMNYNLESPVISRPGQLVVSNADSRAQIVAESTARWTILYFHSTSMLTARLLTEAFPALEVAIPKELWNWFAGSVEQLRSLLQRDDYASAATLLKVIEVVVDQLAVPQVTALRPIDEDRMLAVQAFVDQHAKDPDLGVNLLCKRFHMSRATLYRHMAPFGGVKRYLQNRRLSMAFDEMRRALNKDDSYYRTLALAFQFRSLPDFCQRYRQQFGVDPMVLLRATGEELAGAEDGTSTIIKFDGDMSATLPS